ncbi:MAG TPA: fatty acyl-AMP ligase [Ktedonobacteraceae bacterium]
MKTVVVQPESLFPTLTELLQWRANHQSARPAYTFLADGETQELSLTYGELDLHARAIAASLQTLAARGERALLLYPPGLDYIAAFFGCLYAGVVAVPAYPPQAARFERSLPRLQGIKDNSQATVVLTNAAVSARTGTLFKQAPDFRALHWLATEHLSSDHAAAWHDPGVSEDSLAFLQYTSGSTGQPKGVMVTHRNLLSNHRMIQDAIEHPADQPYVSWLPIFHDMGLIGVILQSLYCGAPCIFFSPHAFIQKPLRWLEALSRYQGHTSHAPNFAYDLCVSKTSAEQRASLDLSHWKFATISSEPVRKETMERFAQAFAPAGFRPEIFCPAYGLAEATLCVTVKRKYALPVVRTFSAQALEEGLVRPVPPDDSQASAQVGCGQIPPGEQIEIVDAQTAVRCPPERIGEIWVSGANVAAGYWNRAQETRATFQAQLADSDAGPFMRTGDLGFLHAGEIYITGRLKDLIIIRGRNFYPQDIEATVEHSHQALRADGGAAFPLSVEGQESFVVVQELERQYLHADLEDLFACMRQAIGEHHEVQPHALVLIKPGTLPRTSSGKVQRYRARAQYLAGTLETVGVQHG